MESKIIFEDYLLGVNIQKELENYSENGLLPKNKHFNADETL